MSQVACHISCHSAQERAPAVATAAFTALAGIGAAVAVIASTQPAQAQTFQQAMDNLASTNCGSVGPCTSFGVAGGSGGQVEVPTGGQWPGISQRLRELLVLVIRAVAPVDVVGLGQRRDLFYPPLQAGMVGTGLVRRCGMGHGC